eukprot:scaffold75617_cov45-Phaeocystis_antarctica.AAC.1
MSDAERVYVVQQFSQQTVQKAFLKRPQAGVPQASLRDPLCTARSHDGARHHDPWQPSTADPADPAAVAA